MCVCLVFAVGANNAATGGSVLIQDEAVPLANVLKPDASGDETHSGGGVTVDASNSGEGYVMVKYSGSNSKVKVLIQKSGSKTQYQYNLNGRSYQVFPFASGNGTYKIGVYENISGNSYSTAYSCSVKVELRSATLPFLYPNQYVNFNKDSEVVALSDTLAAGAADQVAIVDKVYNYVISNISYDDHKAQTVKSGYLPDVDAILTARKGICFDYAAVMASMLRAQGIPTRLEVGYVSGGAYHAWLSTYLKDIGWVNGVIYFDGKNWEMMDPTFASGAGAKYVGDGTSYQVQYLY
jgi:hypothetical protein